MTAIDTETTGLDLRHGARPYFVATCSEHGGKFWQWDVDPYTRAVDVPAADVEEIVAEIRNGNGALPVVGQNIKFDVTALGTIGITGWDWDVTEDTLVAGHVLASNQRHDLTALAMTYVGWDIKPYEDRVGEVVQAGRRRVQQARLARERGKPKPPTEDALADWAIAEAGRPDMPSAGSDFWKADMWLARALAVHDGLPVPKDDCRHDWQPVRGLKWKREKGDRWRQVPDDRVFEGCRTCGGRREHVVLREYGVIDPEATLRVWTEAVKRLHERGLFGMYREKMKAVPWLKGMEDYGTTVNLATLHEQKAVFMADAANLSAECVGIAARYGYDLTLPKGGRNGSLDGFVFDVLNLPRLYNPKAKTDRPSFDAKLAIPFYLETLPPESDGYRFVSAFEALGRREKAVGYQDSYKTFGLPHPVDPRYIVLHATFNAAGTSLLRRSCSDPNLQQVGKKKETNLRRAFGPAPGREWWSLDYKNLELRIPAYEANEPELMALFERPDDPPYYGSEHLLNFHTVYPDVWEDALLRLTAELGSRQLAVEKVGPWVKKEYEDTYYQWCKNGDFAVGYNAVNRPEGRGTADRTFRRPGSQTRLETRFALKSRLNQQWIEFARRHGYVETMPDREVCPERGYPLMVTYTERGEVLPTVPLSFHVQGTAGWIQTKSINRCGPVLAGWTREDQRGYYMIMEVHDELVFDFPAGTGPEPWRTNIGKIRVVQRLMEKGGDDVGVPTPVDVEYCPVNWADGVTVKNGAENTPPKRLTGPAAWLAAKKQLTTVG